MRPIPPLLLQFQFALCGLAALSYATSRNSARRRNLAVGLNALAFAGLRVATAHGIVSGAGFCPSCLATWTGLGLGLLIQTTAAQVVRWWIPAILAGSLALRITAQGSGDSALIVQNKLRRGLTQMGFNYVLPRTSLLPGNVVPGLNTVSGMTVFLTQCSPCTRKALEEILASRKVQASALTFIVPDTDSAWQAPQGFVTVRRIVNQKAWKMAGIVPFGPPCLVRMERGEVKEVLL